MKKLLTLVIAIIMMMSMTVFAADVEDGEYSCEMDFSGGSGKAYIESPCVVNVENGEITATLVWSSTHYDYMIVNGEKYLNENVGGQSTFTIKIDAFDEDINVIGDTTAMSTPHEIEYVINIHAPKTCDENCLGDRSYAIFAVAVGIILLFAIVTVVSSNKENVKEK